MKQLRLWLAILFFVLAGSYVTAGEITLCDHDNAIIELPGTGSGDATTDDLLDTCGECLEGDDCYGWYGLVEALGLARNNRTHRAAVIRVTDEGTTARGTLLRSTGDLTFGLQPGMRLLVGWRQDEFRAYELSYFGIFNWQASATVMGANNLAIPGDLGLASLDFFAADRMTLHYTSRLHNVEANLVESFATDWSLLAGFRYLTLNEDFGIRSTDLDTGTSNYNIHTTNNLFGAQTGARVCRCWDRFGWDATAKAGIFGNAASQTQSVSDFPPGFFLRDRRGSSGGQVAFVGDINLSAFYQLNDAWGLRAGYNLLWVQGVALAPDQLDFSDTPTSGTGLNDRGGLFAHGLSVGIHANW